MKFILIVALLIFSSLLHAYEVDKINANDTLEQIARRNLYRVSLKYNGDVKAYMNDIKKWNPKITDWQNLVHNQIIYVDYPFDIYVSGTSWAPELGVYEEPNELNQRISMNAFYASSFGSYTETTEDQTVKSGQNFPVTFGLGFSAANEDKVHFVQGSVYWAQPSKGKVSDNNENSTSSSSLSIPGEVGGNIYYQNFLKERSLGIYGGYDFEKLNTFNTDQLANGASVTNVDNQIHYATVGVSQGFSLMNYKMNLKASISKSLASNTSGAKALTGMKYILYYTYKPEGRFSFSAFYKHHTLSGPTKLSIDRIGLSIGIMVF